MADEGFVSAGAARRARGNGKRRARPGGAAHVQQMVVGRARASVEESLRFIRRIEGEEGAGAGGKRYAALPAVQSAMLQFTCSPSLHPPHAFNASVGGAQAVAAREIRRIVCLGLGPVHASRAAQFQLGLLLAFRQGREVLCYDPVFDQDDWLVLQSFQIDQLEVEEVCSFIAISYAMYLTLCTGCAEL